MHRVVFALSLVAAMVCAVPKSWSAPLPYAGDPSPTQLQVLAPLVGDWTLDIQVAPNANAPQGMHFTGKAVGERYLNDQFIRLNGQTSNGTTREEYSILYSYDARKSVYRRWYFSSIGLASEFEGHWDDAKQEMTWTLLNPSPNQTATIVDTITPNQITTRVAYKDGDGKIVRSAVNRATREPSPRRP